MSGLVPTQLSLTIMLRHKRVNILPISPAPRKESRRRGCMCLHISLPPFPIIEGNQVWRGGHLTSPTCLLPPPFLNSWDRFLDRKFSYDFPLPDSSTRKWFFTCWVRMCLPLTLPEFIHPLNWHRTNLIPIPNGNSPNSEDMNSSLGLLKFKSSIPTSFKCPFWNYSLAPPGFRLLVMLQLVQCFHSAP